MKNIKKLILMAFVMVMATSTDLFCKYGSKGKAVTFKNNLGVAATLTGPRGSKSLANGASAKIMPKTDPVQYTVAADGYDTYSGTAKGGSVYTITDEDGVIAVN